MLKKATYNSTIKPLLSQASNGFHSVLHAPIDAYNYFANTPERAEAAITKKVTDQIDSTMGGLVDKFAPYLALPVAYGMMNNMMGNNNSTGQQQAPIQSNYLQPNYIQPHLITPQSFKTASLQTKLIKSVANKINNKSEEKKEIDNKSNVSSTDIETHKLLQNPSVKAYIENLVS